MVYPEGTRSDDGKILGFVSEYFETIITDYLIPRMKSGGPIKIGILASDVLSAFPDGVGEDVPAYDKQISLKGIAYNPSAVVEKLQKKMDAQGNISLEPDEIIFFGRMMLIDMREQMAQALVSILNKDEEKRTDANS